MNGPRKLARGPGATRGGGGGGAMKPAPESPRPVVTRAQLADREWTKANQDLLISMEYDIAPDED